jgi:hypothetical protein
MFFPPPVFSRVRVTRSLVFCVCFGHRSLSFCTFDIAEILLKVALASQWGLQLIFRMHNSDPTPQRVKTEISFCGLNAY